MSAETGAWANVTVEECCEILDRKRVPVNGEDREKRIGEVPYYGANGLQGYIDAFIFDEPLILIAEDGGRFDEYSTRPIAYRISGKSWVNNHAHVLKANEAFCQDAIFYSLEHKDIQSFIVGGTRSKLNQSALRAITISLPESKPEQTKIAEILSTVDRAIEQTEALIAKQQRLKTGLMQDLLTRGIDEHGNLRSEQTHKFKDSPLGRIPVEWEFTNFGRVLSQSGGHIQTGPFGSQLHSDEYVSEGVPVVMPQDINRGMISTMKIARITESRANSLFRHRMHQGDLVFARRGDLSRCAVIHDSEEGWLCGTGCLLMRPPTKALSPRWTSETYQFFTTQLQVDINAVGSTMPNLNTGILSSLQLALPSITEQERIEERLNAAENDESRVTFTLNKLRALKTALMQDLLTGRKRVTALLNRKEASA
jgi:type I restriction enzyme S subunit